MKAQVTCMTRAEGQTAEGDGRHNMLEPAERARRLAGTTMASILTAALFLSVMVDSFVVQTRANSQPRPDRMSSSSSSLAAAATAARSCGGGQLRRVVEGVRGGKSGAGGALSASAVDAGVPGELVDVLGDNAGVLSAEQRTMAATLVQLGQVQQ